MALGAFATINTSSATIVNNHKHTCGGRRDDCDAKRDGRQDGGSQRLAAKAISAMLQRGKEMRRDDGEIKYI